MSLADDWGPHGITVNCLAPGWFKTEQNKVMYEDAEWVAYLVDRIPMRRPGKMSDLEGPVVFLASDASEYITGQTLLVDGGISTGATRALSRRRNEQRSTASVVGLVYGVNGTAAVKVIGALPASVHTATVLRLRWPLHRAAEYCVTHAHR